jgi:xanthine dehydrogenase accessory factor
LTTGEDPEAVARIVAPAGESIGAQTPEEIALSVLTSVVAASRGRLPVPATSFKLDSPAIDTSANQTSSCCDGEQKNIETAAVALATTVKSSCCGG